MREKVKRRGVRGEGAKGKEKKKGRGGENEEGIRGGKKERKEGGGGGKETNKKKEKTEWGVRRDRRRGICRMSGYPLRPRWKNR